ncbi:hypothetical protein QYE76_005206 [Lolium multiflorum]|uniref:DUF4216 domain-containing protein n=1 Tax=Lolium multiflorum TaxID=4521 RepID=A0AAD8RS64_LOLMU|nr:hypothetical protein QYE76_005206 [Lolium multiflorum]
MPSYYCWTKHGERGVMMEDNDEEEEDDDGYPNFPEYDDTEGNEDNEVEDQEAPDEPADDDLGRAIADARRECETEKERCKWVNKTGGGVQVDKLYGMTTVDLNNLGYRDEPFVLAKDVAQVFYVKDMSTKPRKRKHKETNTSNDEPKRHIVLSGKRNIVGVEDKTDMSEDYNQFDEIPPFE